LANPNPKHENVTSNPGLTTLAMEVAPRADGTICASFKCNAVSAIKLGSQKIPDRFSSVLG
jgi:hypothetical protein